MVQDNGIGIPATQLPDLFRLYTRGAKAKRMPGLGLGLYLCQQIITAHQGEIGVFSQPNAGSCFWLTLPISSSLNQS
jgi:signal transduction histidine kinase